MKTLETGTMAMTEGEGPDAMGIVERDLNGQREADDLGGEEEVPQPDGSDAPAEPPPAKS